MQGNTKCRWSNVIFIYVYLLTIFDYLISLSVTAVDIEFYTEKSHLHNRKSTLFVRISCDVWHFICSLVCVRALRSIERSTILC